MGKLFDEIMQGLLEAVAMETETMKLYVVDNMPALTLRAEKESIVDAENEIC